MYLLQHQDAYTLNAWHHIQGFGRRGEGLYTKDTKLQFLGINYEFIMATNLHLNLYFANANTQQPTLILVISTLRALYNLDYVTTSLATIPGGCCRRERCVEEKSAAVLDPGMVARLVVT